MLSDNLAGKLDALNKQGHEAIQQTATISVQTYQTSDGPAIYVTVILQPTHGMNGQQMMVEVGEALLAQGKMVQYEL